MEPGTQIGCTGWFRVLQNYDRSILIFEQRVPTLFKGIACDRPRGQPMRCNGNLKEVAMRRSNLILYLWSSRFATLVLGHFIVEFTIRTAAERSSTTPAHITSLGRGYARVILLAFPADHFMTLLPPWSCDFQNHIRGDGRTVQDQAIYSA